MKVEVSSARGRTSQLHTKAQQNISSIVCVQRWCDQLHTKYIGQLGQLLEWRMLIFPYSKYSHLIHLNQIRLACSMDVGCTYGSQLQKHSEQFYIYNPDECVFHLPRLATELIIILAIITMQNKWTLLFNFMWNHWGKQEIYEHENTYRAGGLLIVLLTIMKPLEAVVMLCKLKPATPEIQELKLRSLKSKATSLTLKMTI